MDIRLHGSDTARALHAEAPPVDLHADPLLWTRFVGYDLNARHSPPLPGARFGGHLDIPRMVEGGMGGAFFGLVSLPFLDRDFTQICHDQIDMLERAANASQGKLTIVRNADELERSRRAGCIGGLLGIEGAHCLYGRLDLLDGFVERGVRYLGLVHLSSNECGATSYGRAGRSGRGLTPFGRDVIARCEELGVIVDLAHLNREGFGEACALATKPMYVSHTGLSGVHAMWRNIDDEQLRAVADRSGAVGVIFCPRYLGRDGIEGVVEHLLHVLRVAGEDVPALGSDWDGFIRPTKGLEEASKLPLLTDALLARGLPHHVIRKMLRENAVRVLHDVAR